MVLLSDDGGRDEPHFLLALVYDCIHVRGRDEPHFLLALVHDCIHVHRLSAQRRMCILFLRSPTRKSRLLLRDKRRASVY